MKLPALLSKFRQVIYRFDAESASDKINLLKQISAFPLAVGNSLSDYHEALMFTAAYPENRNVYAAANRELKRIATVLKNTVPAKKQQLADSGLPFTQMTTRFTPEMLSILNSDQHCRLELDSFDTDARSLGSVLRITLPATEKEIAAGEEDNQSLLEWLGVKKEDQLSFLLSEFETLNESPFVKELLWQELKTFVNVDLRHISFSRSFNRISDAETFYHNRIEKRIDFNALLHEPLPAPEMLSNEQQAEIIRVVRRAMVLTLRETDTSTYMRENTLRYYKLGRGISIAIYGMDAAHQLPLQSYIGYTLFKNGMPAAYGGSWVFGNAALFGLNILDSFRGGESAYIMGQLLRVYKQAFNLSSIEVEAYQIGKDNEDGINSGAYWFYYRFGFRSVDPKLQTLAAKEFAKISTTKNYRSNRKVLLALAESNITLTVEKQKTIKLDDITWEISKMIVRKYKGMRTKAVQQSVQQLMQNLNADEHFVRKYRNSFEEWALFAECYGISGRMTLAILRKLIVTKELDPYSYNLSVKELLGSLK
ncbi:MAG: hypothetical protein ACK5Z2_18245 [Bacteroidota bacterium]|jgi:hypothetical protein